MTTLKVLIIMSPEVYTLEILQLTIGNFTSVMLYGLVLFTMFVTPSIYT